MDVIFSALEQFDDFYWSYIGIWLVLITSIFFTCKSRFLQLRALFNAPGMIRDILHSAKGEKYGIHPVRLYFASVGGMVGLGNVVAVVSVVTIGGPGGLFWMWVVALFGMIVKYCEIYLGIKYRVKNAHGGYDGGPMYFLQAAFKGRFIACLVAIFLMVYGVEVYQFVTLTDTFVSTFGLNRYMVIAALLAMVYYTALGGIKRMSTACSILMPPFMLLYLCISGWVVILHFDVLLEVLASIIPSAFEGHAAVSGFAGSTMLMAASKGAARAVYSGDIGIGYDATVQSETRIVSPEKQARVSVFALLSDTIICTCTCLLVLVTGLWKTTDSLQLSEYVLYALSPHIPYVSFLLAAIFFFAGFTTIIGYFTVGLKASRFLHPKFGPVGYLVYGCVAFVVFSFFDQSKVMLLMSISGGLLVLFNLLGILKLRNEIRF